MRFRARLSLGGATVLTLILTAAAAGAPASLAAPGASKAIVARGALNPSYAWSDFRKVAFANQSVGLGGNWQTTVVPPDGDLRHITLRFVGVTASKGGVYRIELRDAGARLLASYDADFLAAHSAFATPPLKPGAITVEVRGPVSPGELAFQVDQMRLAMVAERLTAQSLMPGLILYNQMDPGLRKLARGVVLLTIAEKEVCTGFLVPGGRIVTAFHCLAQSKDYGGSAGNLVRGCSDITIAFDYTAMSYGPIDNPHCKAIDPATPGVTPDIAILRLDGGPPGPPGREMTLASSDPTSGQELLVLEQPDNLPISAARDCHVQGAPVSPKFKHDCSTVGGASGSPILNTKGEVVGVHTDGFIDDGATSPEVVRAYYQACLAGHCPANQGTLVSAFRAALH